MDTIEYNGQIYKRNSVKWYNPDTAMVVSRDLQIILDNRFSKEFNYEEASVEELVAEGDKFKENGSYGKAIKNYEFALRKSTEEETKYILPRITSCYRKENRPEDVISMFSAIKEQYGSKFFNKAMLTSVAAAYCDLGKYKEAKICADRAMAMSAGKAAQELINVYARIKSNTY